MCMTPREVTGQATQEQTRTPSSPFTSRSLTLYGQRSWAAVIFFGCLCIVHACIALKAGWGNHWANRWETILGTTLAVLFAALSIICSLMRTELTISPTQRSISIRRGVGRFRTNRKVPFAAVQAIRLSLGSAMEPQCSRIEIVCDTELIECPPTHIPRQEALYLALVFGVRLIKIYGTEWDPPRDVPVTSSNAPTHPAGNPAGQDDRY